MAEQLSGAAGGGFRRPDGPELVARLHLLLGDSVASRAPLAATKDEDRILCRARGGETWSSLLPHLDADLRAWREEARLRECQLGEVILWLSGNDVYSRLTGLPSFGEKKLHEVGRLAEEALSRLTRQGMQVTVLGPLPRPDGEVTGAQWSHTAAFHLERRLVAVSRDRLQDQRIRVCGLGRALTKKLDGRKRLENCGEYFMRDGIHLSVCGYQKVAQCESFPQWLSLG